MNFKNSMYVKTIKTKKTRWKKVVFTCQKKKMIGDWQISLGCKFQNAGAKIKKELEAQPLKMTTYVHMGVVGPGPYGALKVNYSTMNGSGSKLDASTNETMKLRGVDTKT